MSKRSAAHIDKSCHITELFMANGNVTQLMSQLKRNEELIKQIRQLLPTSLAAHVSAALMQNNNLVLWVTGPVWASRLRFSLFTLRSQFPDIQNIRVAVLPEEPVLSIPVSQPKVSRLLSQKNAEHLLEVAKTISDPTIAAVLIKLASHNT